MHNFKAEINVTYVQTNVREVRLLLPLLQVLRDTWHIHCPVSKMQGENIDI